MAINGTFDASGFGSSVSSQATGSYTPTGDTLLLATVYTVKTSGGTIPTMSGNGLTWVQVNTVLPASSLLRQTVFRALGSSPTTGAATADCGGTTQSAIGIEISEFSGVDTGGTNGSAAVVQSATNSASSSTSLTVTLAAFGSANNGTYGSFTFLSGATTTTFTPGTGFTELADSNNLQQQWRADNDTSVDVTTADSGTISGIAVEIKAAAVGGGRVMGALAGDAGLAGAGGLAGKGGGLAG